MKRTRLIMHWLSVACVALMFSAGASAQLAIEITKGMDQPTVIGISPFGWTGNPLPEDISRIVENDLTNSGQFKTIPKGNMLTHPHTGAEVFYRDWRMLGSEYLTVGNLTYNPGTRRYNLTFELFDILSQKQMLKRTIEGGEAELRDIAHYVSDTVYEAITGIRGAFGTKVIYVEAFSNGRYRLMRSDVDGAREIVLLESSQPLLSPDWSPDGKSVAYVSFETGRPAIFRQDLASARREQLTSFRGLNGAPAWSPDGRKMAMVLSKDGNPEIYVLDLATRAFTRLTDHFAIDTEPSWTPDGQHIVFTSNRGGKPQIYQVSVANKQVERLTFDGDYNARARVSPDGKTLVMVHQQGGVFHIATQDMVTGDIRILTETSLDESPTLAPNGAMLMYATKFGGKGILGAVSLDAGVKYRLPSKRGDVREPDWAPYF